MTSNCSAVSGAQAQPDATLRALLRLTWPVAAGYIPMGIAFGMLAASQGLPLWWIAVGSVAIYSGALQFAAVGFMMAAISLPQLAIATFFLSVRHFFYGFSYPLQLVPTRWKQALGAHTITDETYALITSQPAAALSGEVVFRVGLLNWSYWITGSILGGIIINLAKFDATFMGFSLTALFIVLTIEAYRTNPDNVVFFAAVACGLIGVAAGKKYMLLVALLLFSAFAIARAFLRGRKRATSSNDQVRAAGQDSK